MPKKTPTKKTENSKKNVIFIFTLGQDKFVLMKLKDTNWNNWFATSKKNQ